MKRNEIIKKLVAEGFTEKTLASMSDTKINILAERIIGEQMSSLKKGAVVTPKANANPVDIKRMTDQGINVELREDKKEPKEAARTFANQNRKNMPQGTKFQAGRANKNKFKNEERAKVSSITKPFKTLGKTNEIKEEELNEKFEVNQYVLTVKHDNGTVKIRTSGSSESAAIEKVMSSEGCPRRAITKVEKVKKKDDKKAKLASTLKKLHETKEVKEWVEGLVKENYHSLTTKNEIMELIKVKLNEQAAPAPAEPTTKPTTKPGNPAIKPGKPEKTPYPNPWEPPKENPNPDPGPKYELPDFLKFDSIVSSIKDNDVDQITEMIIKRLKK